MKKSLIIAIISLFGMFISNRTIAQKIAYLNLGDVIQSMPEQKVAQENLAQFKDALVQNANDMQSSLQNAFNKFNQDSSKMTAVLKDVKRADLQKKLTELQNEDKVIQYELQKKQNELSQPIQKKILDAVNEVMKDKGYTMVLSGDQIVVGPPTDNITYLVKAKLALNKIGK